jgi:photosystem II stability/assembly factor-like uncharacterized protein
MQPRARFIVVPFLAALILCAAAVAQDWPLRRFNANEGLNGTYWTTDNGKTWKEMTFPAGAESIFFLNPTTGWALINFDNGTSNPGFSLGTTHDAGATWSVTPIKVQVNPNQIILPGQGHLFFVDEKHGWVNLLVQSGSAFDFGLLLRTVDGGKNWTPAKGPGTYEDVRFINPNDGWQLGPHQSELWGTHDGGKTWEQVVLKPPPDMKPTDEATYGLPVFGDETHGAVEAAFRSMPSANEQITHKLLFITSDGGHHWTFNQVGAIQKDFDGWLLYTPTGSVVIVPSVSDGRLVLKKISLDGTSTTRTTISAAGSFSYVSAISFSSPNDGWVSAGACCEAACSTCALKPSSRVSCSADADDDRPMGRQCGVLLSTDDGGKEWTDITLRQRCVIDDKGKHCTVE